MYKKTGRLVAVLAKALHFCLALATLVAGASAFAQTLPQVPTSYALADVTTSGNWKRAYGSQGESIYGVSSSIPSYASLNIAGASAKIWSTKTKLTPALQQPGSTSSRIASCWYSTTGFSWDLTINDGKTHRLAVYFLDWDLGARQEDVVVTDLATGRVLDSRRLTDFRNGVYAVWDVRGSVRFEVSPLVGSAVVSGFFFDATPSPIDVKSYGAVGDGLHDDTAAVQKALDAGGTLALMSRNYAVGVLVMNKPVRLLGPGVLKSRTTLTNTTGLINVTSGALLDGVTVDGNNRVLRLGRVVVNSVDVKFRNCRFQNANQPAGLALTTEGIRIEGNTDVEISDSVISNISAAANGVTGDAAGCARGIEIEQVGSEPPPSEVLIQGSTISNINSTEDGDGIATHGWRGLPINVDIAQCNFINCGKRAIKTLSDGGTIRNITVQSSQPMYSAISVYGSNWDIEGVCATNASFAKVIDIGGGSWPVSNVRVASSWLGQVPSTMQNTYCEGVWAGSQPGVSNLTVENNTVMNVLVGIRMAGGVSNARIASNLISSATDCAIQLGPRYQADYSYPLNSGIVLDKNAATNCAVFLK